MKRLLATLMIAFSAFLPAAAQREDGRQVFLCFENGVGIGSYRDLGASPLIYRGYELSPSLSVGIHTPAWQFRPSISLLGGYYGYTLRIPSLHAWGGHLSLGFEALRSLSSSGPWHLWAGLKAESLFDIRYNPQLSNASVGMSGFSSLQLTASVQYRLPRWLFSGQLWLAPVSLMLRPGFSYINNYDREIANPLAAAFDQYGVYPAVLTGLSTRLCATLLLSRGNRLGLSYDWCYRTSRVAEVSPWRFQQSSHRLTLHFQYSL